MNLCNCDVVAIEANYEEELLSASNLPNVLKQRIRNNHLSNQQAIDLLRCIGTASLKKVLFWHAEPEINDRMIILERAHNCLKAIGRKDIKVAIAK